MSHKYILTEVRLDPRFISETLTVILHVEQEYEDFMSLQSATASF